MSISSEITRIKTNIANAYTACENKGGTLPQTQNSANLAATISNISGSENITWHQCPEAVRNYLAYVAAHPYDPDDYSTTYVDSYASQYQNIPDDVSAANSKPIGKIIDNITFYDNEPNVAEPFSTANKSGTLTALDKLRWYNTTIGAKLDGSNYKRGLNCRDLGGWDCDGGTVRYGVLIRGGEPNPADKALMVDKIGVKTEVQLLPVSEQATAYKKKSVWGIDWAGNDTDNTSVYGVDGDKALWKKILNDIMGSVIRHKPVMFHCGVGADRTGIVAIILEGLLGVRRSDIDQDFELTDFAIGWYPDANNNNLPYRSRIHPTFKPVMDGIKTVPLVGGLSDTFRNHCITFALSCGITLDMINAFRAECIDGNPEVITVDLPSYSVTKSGSNVTFDNNIVTVDEYQGYEVKVSPDSGYVISEVTLTVGGIPLNAFSGEKVNLYRSVTNTLTNCTTDNNKYSCIDGQGYAAKITANSGYTLDGATISITIGGVEMSQNYYKDGVISIPNVTGNVVISVTAVQQGPSYTNLADPTSAEWLANHRITGSGGITTGQSQVTNLIPVMAGDVIRIKNAGSDIGMIQASFPDATSVSGTTMTVTHSYDSATDTARFNISAAAYGYCRFSIPNTQITDVNDIIITRNEEIA